MIRCLNLRTSQVTTVAGRDTPRLADEEALIDGPASQARFGAVYGIVVAPNGVLLVSDLTLEVVRRISAVQRSASASASASASGAVVAAAERMVTTLIGPGAGVQYSQSAAPAFRQTLPVPWPMVLHTPTVGSGSSSSSGGGSVSDERDAGWLYVGCLGRVEAFDLTLGERKQFLLPGLTRGTSGLALLDDGARLLVVRPERQVDEVDLRTGSVRPLLAADTPARQARDLPNDWIGLVDQSMGSLTLSPDREQIVRLKGVNV
jgi:hypothetical protein